MIFLCLEASETDKKIFSFWEDEMWVFFCKINQNRSWVIPQWELHLCVVKFRILIFSLDSTEHFTDGAGGHNWHRDISSCPFEIFSKFFLLNSGNNSITGNNPLNSHTVQCQVRQQKLSWEWYELQVSNNLSQRS